MITAWVQFSSARVAAAAAALISRRDLNWDQNSLKHPLAFRGLNLFDSFQTSSWLIFEEDVWFFGVLLVDIEESLAHMSPPVLRFWPCSVSDCSPPQVQNSSCFVFSTTIRLIKHLWAERKPSDVSHLSQLSHDRLRSDRLLLSHLSQMLYFKQQKAQIFWFVAHDGDPAWNLETSH